MATGVSHAGSRRGTLAPVALALLVDCCLDAMGCLHGGVGTVLPAALAGAPSLLGGTCSPLCMREVSGARVCGGGVQGRSVSLHWVL